MASIQTFENKQFESCLNRPNKIEKQICKNFHFHMYRFDGRVTFVDEVKSKDLVVRHSDEQLIETIFFLILLFK